MDEEWGCALCKPHKHRWAPKKKAKTIAIEKEMKKEINRNRVIASLAQKD